MPQSHQSTLDKIRARILELRTLQAHARALHNECFDLHLIDEQMQMHKLLHDIDIRIDHLTILESRHRIKDNPDSTF